VAVLAVPLGLQMISREQRILAEELQGRANLLLDSAAARAVSPLRAGAAGLATIRNIPATINTMSQEMKYLTITGPSDPPSDDPADRDFIWASNDPAWPAAGFVPGRLRIGDSELTIDTVRRIATDLNAEATASLKDQLEEYRTKLARSQELARRAVATGATTADRAAAQSAQTELLTLSDNARKTVLKLATAPGRAGSVPEFDPEHLQDAYLFHRPVADFVDDGNYFLGTVRLRVSTEKIRIDIAAATRELIRTLLVIAIVAVALGILGAAILAGITIRPVRMLVAGVAKIRDTDGEKLKSLEGFEIRVNAKDETGMLAAAVNEMTRGLVRAAKDKEELLFGKSLQKQFIPLDTGPGGEKGSMALSMTPAVHLCGYYEGAKGVSGDYFDFHALDDRHYALINCDVAGKGVPAAMIMVEVATLFISWCNEWNKRGTLHDGKSDAGAGLNALVLMINDMLEERGFKGLFAALTVGVLDTTSGMLDVCSAGNNVLHVYSARRSSMIQQDIPQTPAAGVFPSELVLMKSGFPQVRMPLDHGDALFLFTDGFEESKRSFRAYGGDEVTCHEPGLKEGEAHGQSHTVGQASEEFGIPRITGIVNAVFSRDAYTLKRHHTVARETLEFDFSSCAGTVEDAVLALVSVEKMFRIYRDPSTGTSQRINIEPRVDAFLEKHFRHYRDWFSHRIEGEKSGDTITYSHLKEDPQYDDLTLLVVRRP
jgi:hypothetical protein